MGAAALVLLGGPRHRLSPPGPLELAVKTKAEFGSAAIPFRRRVSVWMTYGDGRHAGSSIDDVRTSRPAALQ
jgi:hypothetical protein